ncbi:hypothetical protein AcV7_004161 [Taiwanofungus camphoratus]|nr:hypothetical protein AcV7_004161 [Antrodia cinnamomea]
MAPSNLAVLTSSHRIVAAKKRARREQIKEIVFDDAARSEFLTGFHKRKLAKKEAARKKAQEREKQERLDARREKRQLLAARAAQNAAETEEAYRAHVGEPRGLSTPGSRSHTRLSPSADGEDESGAEWAARASSSRSAPRGEEGGAEREEEYGHDEHVATVTVVEDFDPDVLIHGPLRTQLHAASSRDGSPSPSPAGHDDTPAAPSTNSGGNPGSRPKSRSDPDVNRSKMKSRASAKAKSVKYQTNAARKAERTKQRRRKTEKAERAGGRAARKTAPGRRKR